MDAAAKLARQLRGSPRAKLEATRMELMWKAQHYQNQIRNLQTMIDIINEGIAEIKIKLAAGNDGTERD